MKKLILIPALCLIMSGISLAQQSQIQKDKVNDCWVLYEDSTKSEEENYGPEFFGEGMDVKVLCFSDDKDMMIAAFVMEDKFACPGYPKISVKNRVITAKSTPMCRVEDKVYTFVFSYQLDNASGELLITFNKKTFRYVRYKSNK